MLIIFLDASPQLRTVLLTRPKVSENRFSVSSAAELAARAAGAAAGRGFEDFGIAFRV